MTLATILGLIAGVLNSIRLIPQVYRSLKLKETKDLSLVFVVILIFQGTFLIL
jgi:uncharacterized protein with PQ loop repeat